MSTAVDPVDVLRDAVAGLSDDTIRGALKELVRGLIQGAVDELAARVDELAETATASLINEVANAAEQSTAHSGAAPEPSLHLVPKVPRRRQDGEQRTCEVCGRTGTRRFDRTETGWRCSATATKCPGNRIFPPPPAAAAAVDEPHKPASEICPKPEPAQVAEAEPVDVPAPPTPAPSPPPAPAPPGVTARCKDCTRNWNLTGRVLDMAVEQHEFKHSHIVEVLQ